MSDESVVREFEQQQVGRLKLSEAIRIGAHMVPETLMSYCGCALGTAYIAATGRRLDHALRGELGPADAPQLIADTFGVPLAVAVEVEDRHCRKESREAIADWLESEGR